jgi:hypothetical protein
LDSKTQTVLATGGGKTTHFMSPIGPLQLTAEECNEILMKRAAAAVAANNQHAITTTTEGHHAGMCMYTSNYEYIFSIMVFYKFTSSFYQRKL